MSERNKFASSTMKRMVEQVVRAAMLLDKLRLPTESRQRMGRSTGLEQNNIPKLQILVQKMIKELRPKS